MRKLHVSSSDVGDHDLFFKVKVTVAVWMRLSDFFMIVLFYYDCAVCNPGCVILIRLNKITLVCKT